MRKPTTAAVLLVALLGAGCGGLGGRTVGRAINDASITARVKTRLLAHHIRHVDVDAYDGTVYLLGPVDSAETKRRAEQLARRVGDVTVVVNNLYVAAGESPAASPPTDHDARAAARPLLARLPGLDRVDGEMSAAEPSAAYDRTGRRVATVWMVPMLELAQHGLDVQRGGGPAVDHVSIYPVVGAPDVPEPRYYVVLWHVTPAEATALGGYTRGP